MFYKLTFIVVVFLVQSLCGQELQIEQSERLFESEIFKAYRQQYEDQVSHLLPAQLQATDHDPRVFYQRFLTTLRSHDDLDPALYHWYFLGVDVSKEQIQDACLRLTIPQLNEKGYSKPEEIATLIDDLYKQTLVNPEYTGYLHENETYLDPTYSGNFPYLLYSHSFAGKKVQLIRMPVPARTVCPLKELQSIEDVRINEEFEIFLTQQAKEGKKHLYINFLNDWKDAKNQLFHDKLLTLEQNDQFGKCFFIATLDKDTAFYYQKGEFASLDDSKLFLKTFLERLASGKNGYRWPSHLNQKAWNRQCACIVTELHTKLFGSQVKLNVEERQTFIELSYSRLIRALLEEIQPESCNLTCHYTIDRGTSTAAIFLCDLLCTEKKCIPNQLALKLIALMINQPILFQNRPAHSYRVERVTNALRRMGQE